MNNFKKIYLPFIILILMYIIQFQTFLSEKIRQELREVLSYINLFLFPILVLLNIFYWIKITKSTKYTKRMKILYSFLSILLYTFIGYKIIN